jgi:hypothetical protein
MNQRSQERLIIGSDEAGYGPTLGPLVVVATAWGGGDMALQPLAFDALTSGHFAVGPHPIRIADSKQVFQRSQKSPLEQLERAVLWLEALRRSFAQRQRSTFTTPSLMSSPKAIPMPSPKATASTPPQLAESAIGLRDWIGDLARDDVVHLAAAPWYGGLDEPLGNDAMLAAIDQAVPSHRDQMAQWQVQPIAWRARILDAEPFNRGCQRSGNKATLLSETTVGLIGELIAACNHAGEVEVWSDKHGGRAYYAPLLQHQFPQWIVRVIREGASLSQYRIERSDGAAIEWTFSAKGDRHAPTAASSLIAKHLRERLMEAFNRYWRSHLPDLAPTAGYPSDATRFLESIDPIIDRLKLPRESIRRSK